METLSPAHAVNQYAGGPSPAVLAEIYQPGINLAVWEGGLDWQARLGAETLCRARPGFLCNSHGTAAAVDADVRRRWPTEPALNPLLVAVTDCARMFSELFEPPAIGLRITALDRAMCPRFHVDRIPVRMIVTFCGPGTEWLPNDAMDRNHLGASGAASSPQQHQQQLRAGDVALMKGENWLGNEGNGLVHRSPAVQGHTARLIATIDWLD